MAPTPRLLNNVTLRHINIKAYKIQFQDPEMPPSIQSLTKTVDWSLEYSLAKYATKTF